MTDKFCASLTGLPHDLSVQISALSTIPESIKMYIDETLRRLPEDVPLNLRLMGDLNERPYLSLIVDPYIGTPDD